MHPEGRVIGSIFLSRQNKNYTGSEEPIDALNRKDAFIVLKSEEHEGPKFYNKCAIIRAEYDGEKRVAWHAEPGPLVTEHVRGQAHHGNEAYRKALHKTEFEQFCEQDEVA